MFIFPCFFTCWQKRVNICFLFTFFNKIFSVLNFSLSVLYTVYFVVCCCDLCGVLIIFILCSSCVESMMKKRKLEKTNNTLYSLCFYSKRCNEQLTKSPAFFSHPTVIFYHYCKSLSLHVLLKTAQLNSRVPLTARRGIQNIYSAVSHHR